MMSDQNGIYITKKQASVTLVLLVFLNILIFIAGYFWGKQSNLEDFTQKTAQESFNDQVDYLLTMQSFAAKQGLAPESSENNDQQDLKTPETLENIPDALEESVKEPINDEKVEKNLTDKKSSDKKNKIAVNLEDKHFAALAGFGKKHSAEAMIQRLKKYKINLELKTKVSKSASGKGTRTWYQVVTPKYNSKEEVQRLVDRVVALEHIKRSDIKVF